MHDTPFQDLCQVRVAGLESGVCNMPLSLTHCTSSSEAGSACVRGDQLSENGDGNQDRPAGSSSSSGGRFLTYVNKDTSTVGDERLLPTNVGPVATHTHRHAGQPRHAPSFSMLADPHTALHAAPIPKGQTSLLLVPSSTLLPQPHTSALAQAPQPMRTCTCTASTHTPEHPRTCTCTAV